MTDQFSIVVCASGGGGNFQALINARQSLNVQIVLLIVDRECGAIDRAVKEGIPYFRIQARTEQDDFSDRVIGVVPETTDLIVLAGFMPILPPAVCEHWRGRIINTHPSLLPKFGGRGMYGVKVQEAVMAAGEKQAGCTVHYVDEQIDGGQIILQRSIDVDYAQTPWQLGARVFAEENKLLVEAVKLIRTSGTNRTLGT